MSTPGGEAGDIELQSGTSGDDEDTSADPRRLPQILSEGIVLVVDDIQGSTD